LKDPGVLLKDTGVLFKDPDVGPDQAGVECTGMLASISCRFRAASGSPCALRKSFASSGNLGKSLHSPRGSRASEEPASSQFRPLWEHAGMPGAGRGGRGSAAARWWLKGWGVGDLMKIGHFGVLGGPGRLRNHLKNVGGKASYLFKGFLGRSGQRRDPE